MHILRMIGERELDETDSQWNGNKRPRREERRRSEARAGRLGPREARRPHPACVAHTPVHTLPLQVDYPDGFEVSSLLKSRYHLNEKY